MCICECKRNTRTAIAACFFVVVVFNICIISRMLSHITLFEVATHAAMPPPPAIWPVRSLDVVRTNHTHRTHREIELHRDRLSPTASLPQPARNFAAQEFTHKAAGSTFLSNTNDDDVACCVAYWSSHVVLDEEQMRLLLVGGFVQMCVQRNRLWPTRNRYVCEIQCFPIFSFRIIRPKNSNSFELMYTVYMYPKTNSRNCVATANLIKCPQCHRVVHRVSM